MHQAASRLTPVDAAPPPPPQPGTIEATGLPADQLEQLLVKALYGGVASGLTLADRLRLPYAVLEPLVERARAERLIDVRGADGVSSASYRYALTDVGRDRARQYLAASQYSGAAPVPLPAYLAYMQVLRSTRGYVERDRLRRGFSHLVIGDDILEQLGPAVNANRAVFLYGPPGNGKTVIAQGMGRAIGGEMYVPYALDVDGNIVTMYDPVNHESLEADDPDPLTLIASGLRDRRWVRIRRPAIVVGGELTLDMLDLTFNRLTGFYEAPVQLKANGGVLLVDDFGRQRVRPQDLLNRWIVPLEGRVDYLTLHTGKKFEVPFDTLVAFATNLDPADLADEAFLRRIPYKIHIGDPTSEEFERIFELNCRRRQLPFHRVLVTYLQRRYYGLNRRPMRACHPRDLLDRVTALCRYRGSEPSITRDLLDRACEAYFIDDDKGRESNEVRS